MTSDGVGGRVQEGHTGCCLWYLVQALRDEDIRMPELMEIHQRMMGRTPRAFEQPLPHVDVFERPQARLVFMVDGLSGGWHTPFVNELHRDHFHCRVQG